VLLSAGVYGATPALVKIAFADVSATTLIAFRSIIGAALMMVIARILRVPTADRRAMASSFALGALIYGPQLLVFFSAIGVMSTGIVVAVSYVYPSVILAMTAVARRRLPSRLEMALACLALLGVFALAVGGGSARVNGRGLALTVISAVMFAVYVVLAEPVSRRIHPLRMSIGVLTGIASFGAVFGLASGNLVIPHSSRSWGFVALHGVLIVPVAFTTFYAGLRLIGAARTAMLDTAQPVVAVVVGVLALGEHVDGVQVVGITVVVLAIATMPALDLGRTREIDRVRGAPNA
jgi:drug/metabolite transporter (DMT)-like permease